MEKQILNGPQGLTECRISESEIQNLLPFYILFLIRAINAYTSVAEQKLMRGMVSCFNIVTL